MKNTHGRTMMAGTGHFFRVTVLLAGALLAGCASSKPEPTPSEGSQDIEAGQVVDPELVGAPLAACNASGGVQQCCSAKNCTGKVLSNRDAHNCKVKSTGKSWTPGDGTCTNL